jgi:hypothetical protein
MGTFLVEGTTRLAEMTEAGMRSKRLIAAAPELWDAANEYVKLLTREQEPDETAITMAVARLQNVLAKAVGKADWRDIEQ